MIESRDGVYSVGGTPCKELIEEAVRRGWAKRPKSTVSVSTIEKEPKHVPAVAPTPVPIPTHTPKSVQPMTLEDRARAAGMTVDQLLDMRMRNKERTQE